MKREQVFQFFRSVLFPRYISYSRIYKRVCRSKISQNKKILHLGSGIDKGGISNLKKGNFLLVSLDKDASRLAQNTNKSKVLADAYHLPFKNECFNLIFSENFFEHLEEPKSVLLECRRVLKKGSQVIFAIPNKFSYIAIFNLISPKFIKNIVKKLRGQGISYDPAYYRFNTPERIAFFCKLAGFRINSLHYYTGPPEYFYFNLPLFIVFSVLHKIIEMVPLFLRRFNLTFVAILEGE
ncbi:MAG: class I SAM-dependent methyltransferase [Candidatus Omnitrophica bacterium]|nr:class I SAM-dependent methyltransferase [Candidatus Omnitrophota bacterium]